MRTSHLSLAIAALLLALSLSLAATVAPAAAKSSPRVGKAIALTKGKAKKKRLGTCQRRAVSRARIAAAKAKNARAARRITRRTRKRVYARCKREKRQHAAGEASAVATQVSGDLVIGVDGGWGYWSPEEIEHRTALGAAVTRHEWDIEEPVDEQDDIVESAVGTIGTRIHALLGENDLGDPTHYREWVIEFIGRYGPGGDFWDEHPEYDESRFAITSVELGNEPYFGHMSPQRYADTVEPTLLAIRALALPVRVILPSRVYGENTSWMDTVYERIPNLNDLFHAFADHPYWYGHHPASGGAAGPFERIETLRLRMNELGAFDKPIWITEYGESTANCGSECIPEATQAAHLSAMLQGIVSRPDWGIKMFSVFQLLDRGTGSGDRELQFGLLREDGTPKPSYGILRAAMQQFRG